MKIDFKVNGAAVSVEVTPRMTLADCLRHELHLTGTHVGCEHGVCGACTVIVNGDAVRGCLMLAVQAQGASVTTVEGLSLEEGLTPLQQAFKHHHALQCGFCTPGMVMSAIDLVNSHPEGLTEQEIREGLEGNLCRCTGYHNIVKAIAAAHPLMHAKAAE